MEQRCNVCLSTFVISPEDDALRERVAPVIDGQHYSIPAPTLCSQCRLRRRLSFRNERHLFHRSCDSCRQPIISMYAPENNLTVYCRNCWWSDNWDALSFGKAVDLNRRFTDQVAELWTRAPLLALANTNNQNSDYVNQTDHVKDCYLIFSAVENEHCYYGMRVNRSRHCVDSFVLHDSELTYQCLTSKHLYQCAFCQNCSSCSDSRFLFDCAGCHNCLLCYNLRNQSCCIENEPLTKAEYERGAASIFAACRSVNGLRELKDHFRTLVRERALHRATYNINCEDCAGDCLTNSRDAFHCFHCDELEHARHAVLVTKSKYVGDVNNHYDAELAYEVSTGGLPSYQTLFCIDAWPGHSNTTYCSTCPYSKDLFGCVGLRHKQYCILNRQYSKADYETLVPQIIAAMRREREWGEFFDPRFSLFGYNYSVASEYFPLTREEAMTLGFRWSSYEASPPDVKKVYMAAELPTTIDATSDDILGGAIICERSKRPFRITSPELQFYRQQGFPVPQLHPDERHRDRLSWVNPRTLSERRCTTCEKPILSSYPSDAPKKVLCDSCYFAEVY